MHENDKLRAVTVYNRFCSCVPDRVRYAGVTSSINIKKYIRSQVTASLRGAANGKANRPVDHWHRKHVRLGHTIGFSVVTVVPAGADWGAAERDAIENIPKEDRLNLAVGGQGVSSRRIKRGESPKRSVYETGQQLGWLVYDKEISMRNGVRRGRFVCTFNGEGCVGVWEGTFKAWLSGNTTSCGCRMHEPTHSTHGATSSKHGRNRIYTAYHTMLKVKERGIDPLWETFEGFRGNQPPGVVTSNCALVRTGEGVSGDGTYNSGGFYLDNCVWRSKALHNRLIRESEGRMHALPDGRFCIDVAKSHGIPKTVYLTRVHNKWDLERACTEPVNKALVLENGMTIEKYALSTGIALATVSWRVRAGWAFADLDLPAKRGNNQVKSLRPA
jgi:hypothetical protein